MSSAFPESFCKVEHMGSRAPQICTTIDEMTHATLQRIREETGISEVELSRALLKAACNYYQSHGSITLPIVIAAKREPATNDKR